jgi:hypothetical protein
MGKHNQLFLTLQIRQSATGEGRGDRVNSDGTLKGPTPTSSPSPNIYISSEAESAGEGASREVVGTLWMIS